MNSRAYGYFIESLARRKFFFSVYLLNIDVRKLFRMYIYPRFISIRKVRREQCNNFHETLLAPFRDFSPFYTFVQIFMKETLNFPKIKNLLELN